MLAQFTVEAGLKSMQVFQLLQNLSQVVLLLLRGRPVDGLQIAIIVTRFELGMAPSKIRNTHETQLSKLRN